MTDRISQGARLTRNALALLIGVLVLSVGATAVAEHVKGYTRKDGTYVHPYERGSTRTTPSSHSKSSAPDASVPSSVPRDADGHIKRSSAPRAAFERSHPCPSTGKTTGSCPGYVVDHVKPLKRGGADTPENMQWQTVEAAKAKDKVE